jgi:hypothetical protein
MGCDGGTIPKRHELVKLAAKKEEKDSHSALISRWFYCASSNEPLVLPIAADRWYFLSLYSRGRLYNRESLLSAILTKKIPGVTKFKTHTTTLSLTLNPSSSTTSSTTFQDAIKVQALAPQYICPITLREMNGKNAFVYLASCGCVFSELG